MTFDEQIQSVLGYRVKDDAVKATFSAIKTIIKDSLRMKKEYPEGCSYEEETGKGWDCTNSCEGCIYGYSKGKIQGWNECLADFHKEGA